jgi:hypothetical protein
MATLIFLFKHHKWDAALQENYVHFSFAAVKLSQLSVSVNISCYRSMKEAVLKKRENEGTNAQFVLHLPETP